MYQLESPLHTLANELALQRNQILVTRELRCTRDRDLDGVGMLQRVPLLMDSTNVTQASKGSLPQMPGGAHPPSASQVLSATRWSNK